MAAGTSSEAPAHQAEAVNIEPNAQHVNFTGHAETLLRCRVPEQRLCRNQRSEVRHEIPAGLFDTFLPVFAKLRLILRFLVRKDD